jgi:thymidine phosphorylase
MKPGTFFFIVGPSGSGKDSLMSGVKPFLPETEFVFARRVITREASPDSEDHDSCSESDFLEREKQGDFIITWQAHGLYYGLPVILLEAIQQGIHVIANGSRNEILILKEKIPSLQVIEITAPIDVLRKRLIARHRETSEDIERRLQRATLTLPEGIRSLKIKNDVTLEIGISRLKATLLLDNSSNNSLSQLIYRKTCGAHLSRSDYEELLPAIIQNTFPLADVQAFLIACTESLEEDEVISIAFARTLLYPRIQWSQAIVMDKHSLGGILGNRVSMVVIPIIAAYGLLIPKTSSCAITSAAGTADTMEVLAKVDLNFEELQACVNATNACIVWNGKLNHSVLDDAMNPMTRSFGLDTRNWSVASILSKKFTAGSTHVVIDIPYVSSGKVKTFDEAYQLAQLFERVGQAIGLVVKAFPTDGRLPIGSGVGPSLEARDVLQVLQDDPRASQNLVEKSLFFAAHLLALDEGVGNFDTGYQIAMDLIKSGAALQSMQAIIAHQGKMPEEHLKVYMLEICSDQDGFVSAIDDHRISGIARLAGAPLLKSAGIDLKTLTGEAVQQGQILYMIQSTDQQKLQDAYAFAIENHGFTFTQMKNMSVSREKDSSHWGYDNIPKK